ncbi:MAG TPA: TonB-dependent receptor [Gemmatimonadaceae bacterium]|nr:TonB-dependent receptor [Gemmatimonadaceae bacterium]
MTPIRLLVAVALMLCVARPATAQSDRSGRIEGTVRDSAHARPLAGARVVAVGTGLLTERPREATSDSAGKFHIDSLPIGRYFVGFESPLLDSLEIVVPPRAATIAAGGPTTVNLATPPAVKLREALCPGVPLPEGTGVVYGRVVSAETESPLADVVVAILWRDLSLWDSSDHKTLRPVNSQVTASVSTDRGGWYRACGVPRGAWLWMQLQREGRVGPVLHMSVEDTLGIAIRHVSLSSSATRDSAFAVSDTSTAPFTGTAALTGVVRGAAGTPVPSAEVRVRGTRSTGMTDALGSYTLSALPAGTHELEVRRIGYEAAETWVELRSGATTTRDLRMRRIVNLDSIRVVATRTRYRDFQRHREQSMGGIFLGPEDMARQHVAFPSDIVEKIPGFRVVGYGPSAVVVANRGEGYGRCEANIVIDGAENRSINELIVADVGAMEVYRGGYPAQWTDRRGCGTIAMWTKR